LREEKHLKFSRDQYLATTISAIAMWHVLKIYTVAVIAR